jgi:2-phospho-L-lactate guanylyltransferase
VARVPAATVDLVIPVKPLWAAKSRLRGAVGDAAHARLALALALDTIAAARAASRVRNVLVMSTDAQVAAGLAAEGVAVAPDGPVPGLNAALEHGAGLLRARDAAAAVGALQADLPALLPDELDEAVARAATAFAAGEGRAFCADAAGTGTTLLLAAAGAGLEPRFGRGSAQRHRASGAVELHGAWPGLRHDVDTGADLARATDLGLGARTRDVLALAAPS